MCIAKKANLKKTDQYKQVKNTRQKSPVTRSKNKLDNQQNQGKITNKSIEKPKNEPVKTVIPKKEEKVLKVEKKVEPPKKEERKEEKPIQEIAAENKSQNKKGKKTNTVAKCPKTAPAKKKNAAKKITEKDDSTFGEKTEFLENAQLTKLMSHAEVRALIGGQMLQDGEADVNSCRDTVDEVDSEMQDIVFSPLLLSLAKEELKVGKVPENQEMTAVPIPCIEPKIPNPPKRSNEKIDEKGIGKLAA